MRHMFRAMHSVPKIYETLANNVTRFSIGARTLLRVPILPQDELGLEGESGLEDGSLSRIVWRIANCIIRGEFLFLRGTGFGGIGGLEDFFLFLRDEFEG